MKKIDKLILIIAIILTAMSCNKDDDKIIQDPAVIFQKGQASISLDLDFNKDTTYNIGIRLMGPKQNNDITVNISIDNENTNAINNSDYELSSMSIIIPAGESFANFPLKILAGNLTPYNLKTLTLKIESASGANSFESETTISMNKKIIFNADNWAGAYTFYGDGWSRDWAELRKIEGETHKMIMYGFWGSEEELTCNIDDNTPNKIILTVPSGTLLDPGWDDEGQWWLSDDLVGEMDRSTMTITFTQFSYVTDAGTEGEFPWCSGTCSMIKQ